MAKKHDESSDKRAGPTSGSDLWVDESAIPSGSWLHVPLHPPGPKPSAAALRGSAHGRFAGLGRAETTSGPRAALARSIPRDRILLVGADAGQNRRIPGDRIALRTRPVAGSPPPEQTLTAATSPVETFRTVDRRGKALAWAFLLVGLLGTWGTFFGMTGGIKSNDKSKPITIDQTPSN